MKVGIIGAAGRMGRILIEATLANPDTTLAAAVDVPGSSLIGADAGELVGQGASGVMLADAVPHYLAHLFSLGLLAGGPEDNSQTAKYEAIENGSEVRSACERMRKESRLRPVFIRETAHLSSFGKAFWAACSG